MQTCTVCRDEGIVRFAIVDETQYWRCNKCLATLLDPEHYLTAEAELAHYNHHQNRIDDPGYRTFLTRLADPIIATLKPGSSGLDYGCGPGPALAEMLTEAGMKMSVYDPFFALDKVALSTAYDFITCTETAEHFHNPADEFDRLDALLKPGGTLAVMTCFQTDDAAFATWHYRRDPTHVVFYRAETFNVIAARHGWVCEVPTKDVVFLHKPH